MTNNYFKVKGGLEVPDADDFWIGETLTPSIRPSLLLDFAKGKQLDGRVIFTRDSTATYYDGKSTAKAEENLLKYSNDFSNAVWLNGNGTVTRTSGVADPVGGTSAYTLTFSANLTYITQAVQSSIVTGSKFTSSIWVRNANAGMLLRIFRDGTGTAESSQLNIPVSSFWQRITLTHTFANTQTGVRFDVLNNSGSSNVSIEVYGAQLEQGDVVTGYIQTTTTAAISKYVPVLKTAPVNAPRFNHDPVTGESLGLLIEPEATNYITYSEDFSGRTIANLAARTPNYAVSPNGTLTATRLVENTTANAQRRWYGNIGTVPSYTSATWSVYVKPDDNRKSIALYPNYGGNGYIVDFNLVDLVGVGAQVGNGTGSYTIETVGNGWFRLSVTVNFLTEQTGLNYFGYFSNDVNDGNAYYTGDGVSGILIWGEQIELGSTLTSYIPTSGSAATRKADDCTVTLGSWYNQSEGTIFTHAKTNVTDNNRVVVNAQNGTYNRIGVSTCQAIGYNLAYIGNNYDTQLTRSFGSASTGYRKVALAYANNNSNTAVDGNVSTEDTQCTIPAVSQFRIGGISTSNNVLNGHIKKIAYYPKRLSNQELVDMTE